MSSSKKQWSGERNKSPPIRLGSNEVIHSQLQKIIEEKMQKKIEAMMHTKNKQSIISDMVNLSDNEDQETKPCTQMDMI